MVLFLEFFFSFYLKYFSKIYLSFSHAFRTRVKLVSNGLESGGPVSLVHLDQIDVLIISPVELRLKLENSISKVLQLKRNFYKLPHRKDPRKFKKNSFLKNSIWES